MKNDFHTKKTIEHQNYEQYWKFTLAYTNFLGKQTFKRALQIIVDHIDKYDLGNKKINELKNGKNKFNNEVAHNDVLEQKLVYLMGSNGKSKDDNATARKKINTFIKLGFVNPFYHGYAKEVKTFLKSDDKDEQTRIFSDIIYSKSSFNSSQTNDDRGRNQIQFLIKTILNRPKDKRYLTYHELIGLMTLDIKGKDHAYEKEIEDNKKWADYTGFADRKYNQIRYVISTIGKLSMFTVVGTKEESKIMLKGQELDNIENTNTKRDPYRFGLMKKAVYEESEKLYGRKICWLTKKETEGLVVSHLYRSENALRNFDFDDAYDPNNALLLAPGNPDQYIDKYKMTISDDGGLILSDDVMDSFKEEVMNEGYHIDKKVLNEQRMHFIKKHQKEFKKRHNISKLS
ncbi:hypothetical protein DY042_04100 [Apilactobacillus kunkeei]|uniref:hypothetical protein n=1 Tax=Apilactobacillus kunkeei TaxID=148814 RepID=UPI00112E4923|nr:hypothetical protein [Apilactobacillus kunkeei]TPR51136.1 hypothetical protein DY042_04100 [Apilactobacillus kunkeei]WJV43524.1 hypothetical protein QSV47_00565 [Apilactobacillus kunkeei]